ncbi:MAG TPA: helix-turn-helix transcriptional regulator [Actinophytocola sp.]|uniref:helix-turn-helix transcriptional regulator n=1 Tax=Actinophytocola sp. TaxID=1872138 RepID=UPI002DDCF19F|nr:helix-turn-helix transcriptional regulator [Actinophytocola sp.]HEV2784091.1 helix-turn-helix transcriptional regulator [Actinophytocola sp.]
MTATAMPAPPRRAALGHFLKAHRARLSPQDVGLPAGARRRTSGLRREEVALLAGVGVTWYTWLEQGRPINASDQVLDAVARTLRLNPAERAHLYQLADAAPRYPPVAGTVPESLHEMLRSLDPLPASLINGRYDVLARNRAQEDLFRAWHPLPCVHGNVLWCCFAEPGGREKLVDYEAEVRHLVARLRAEYAAHIGDPEWEEDIRRLAERSPDFAELWARHEVAAPAERVRRFRHPQVGLLTLVYTELAVPAEGLRMAVYTPRDAETRHRLSLTRSREQRLARVG